MQQVIKNVFTEHYTSLYESTGNSLQLLADKMYAAGFITIPAPHSFSFAEIFYEFQAGLNLMMSVFQTEQSCAKFLSILTKIGGQCAVAGQALQDDLIQESKAKCGVELQLGM